MIAPHQQSFANNARPYEGLWDGTGTGKTRTALWAVAEYAGSILVVAPKTSVQKQQWLHEAELLGLPAPTVISYETFRRDHKTLPPYEAVIADEAHRLFGVTPYIRQRNRVKIPKASQIYEAMEWYLDTHRPVRFIPATATPNKTPMSIWAAARLLGHTGIELDFYTFRANYYVRLPMDAVVFAPKRDKDTMEELALLTRRIGRVLRLEDIKDVPEQTFITETFPLTSSQTTALKTLPSRFTDTSSLRLKRHQIENGVLYEDQFNPITRKVTRQAERFDSQKIDYIVERALEFSKMVIFANYTEQVEAIAEALRKDDKTRKVYTLTGQTENRKQVCEEAEAARSAYIVAQASVSSEWEFKSCPVVIFASLSNRSIDYIQGLGRVQRYDAVKHNLYIHLVTDYPGSVDRRWFDTIQSGKDFNEALYT